MIFRNIAIFLYITIVATTASSSSLAKSSEASLAKSSGASNKKLSSWTKAKAMAKPRIKAKAKARATIGAVGANVNLCGLLFSTKGGKLCPHKWKELSFRLGETNLGKSKTNIMGMAYIKYKVPELTGSKKFSVAFMGDKEIFPCRGSAELTIIKSATKISAQEIKSSSASGVTIEGTLARKTDGKALAAREVIATMNGNTVARASTLDSGIYNLSFTVPTVRKRYIILKNGKRTVQVVNKRILSPITVSFRGNKFYEACAVQTKMRPEVISRKPVNISISCGKKTAKIGDKYMFTVIVREGSNGEAVANKTVEFMGQKKKTSGLGSIAFFHKIRNTGKLGPRELIATTKEDDNYWAGEGKLILDVSTR